MKKLIKNAKVINVFTDRIVNQSVLIEDGMIIGVGDYDEKDADEVTDVCGRYVCPGFIDGHIHIESSMLTPEEFVKVCLPHGTTTVVADPHEIANVSGLKGVQYMLEASEGVPMNVCFMMPSCVPATGFDEAGATLDAADIVSFYKHPRILGLGEMMNYPGVVFGDKNVHEKLKESVKARKVINGHAPMLSGHDLDKYISAGIFDDHECSSIEEAKEKLEKGQWIMIRQGTAAKNVKQLIDLFDEPYSRRCLLVTDDKHPADLMENGHIDNIIRIAASEGKSVLTAIRMATIQAATRFGLTGIGAVAPGYSADLLVIDDLENMKIRDVYYKGKLVAKNGVAENFACGKISEDVWEKVSRSFNLDALSKEDFVIKPEGNRCRVIGVVPGQLITNEEILDIDFEKSNGIDISRDILKLAVIERHNKTGHIGLGFIKGMGLKEGAIASSVAHDSHNLIVVGADEESMALAANCVREMGGGLSAVKDGKVLAKMPLPIGGIMGTGSASEMADMNVEVRKAADVLGHSDGIEPFMNLAFVSLPVIPNIKMTTLGLVNVNTQELVPLFLK